MGCTTFKVTASSTWDGSGAGVFTNAGELRKSLPGGSGADFVLFNNVGGVANALTGTLGINYWSGAGATFQVSAGAFVDINAFYGNNISGLYTGTGNGRVRFVGGNNYDIGAPGATFNFPAGMFQWANSTIRTFTNTLTNTGYIQLTGGGTKILIGTLNNAGTVVHAGSGLFIINVAGTFNNLASGLYDFQGDGVIHWDGSGIGTFVNYGTLRKSAGTDGSGPSGQVTFQNMGGTIEALTGSLSIGNLAGSGGTWRALNGATLNLPSPISVLGVNNTAIISGTGSAMPQLNALTLNGGSVGVLGGATLNLNSALTNNGTLHVGAGSIITVSGAFTQAAAGTLTLDVGGPPASNQYGRLNATGAATLNGTLAISLTNGFAPSAAQTWTVMNYASHSGDFYAINGLEVNSTRFFEEVTNPTNVVLNSLVNAADLQAGLPSGIPASGTPGQVVTINFQVTNISTRTAQSAAGYWVDSAYLSSDSVWDLDDKLIGSVTFTGTLAGGASYNASLSAPLPAADGLYRVIVVADSRRMMPDLDRTNNYTVSVGTIAMGVPVLYLPLISR